MVTCGAADDVHAQSNNTKKRRRGEKGKGRKRISDEKRLRLLKRPCDACSVSIVVRCGRFHRRVQDCPSPHEQRRGDDEGSIRLTNPCALRASPFSERKGGESGFVSTVFRRVLRILGDEVRLSADR